MYAAGHVCLNWWQKSIHTQMASPFVVFVFCGVWCCRSGWLSSCCSWNCSCCCFRLLSMAARFCSCSKRCSSLASSFWSCLFPDVSITLGSGVGLVSRCRVAEIHFLRPLTMETISLTFQPTKPFLANWGQCVLLLVRMRCALHG